MKGNESIDQNNGRSDLEETNKQNFNTQNESGKIERWKIMVIKQKKNPLQQQNLIITHRLISELPVNQKVNQTI